MEKRSVAFGAPTMARARPVIGSPDDSHAHEERRLLCIVLSSRPGAVRPRPSYAMSHRKFERALLPAGCSALQTLPSLKRCACSPGPPHACRCTPPTCHAAGTTEHSHINASPSICSGIAGPLA